MDELYRRYAGAVFGLACRMSRDRTLAEDATQDVFVQVWRGAARFDSSRGTVGAWLLVMARTRTMDRMRARRSVKSGIVPVDRAVPSPVADRGASPETLAGNSEQSVMFARLLAILSEGDRQLIELAFFQGLTHPEIAAALELPLGTVKTRIRRTLQLLRSALTLHARPPFVWNGWDGTRPTPAVSPSPLKSLHILVVDDDADTLKLLTLVLERAGAVVASADSVGQALKCLGSRWPDLLMTDIEMPEQDGYALLEQVRRLCDDRAPTFPAVAFTAHGNDCDRVRAERAGFALHMVKPVTPSLLVSRVAELLRGRTVEGPINSTT